MDTKKLPNEQWNFGKYRVFYYASGEICAIADTVAKRFVLRPETPFFRDEKESLLSRLIGR